MRIFKNKKKYQDLATYYPEKFVVWFDKATYPKEKYWCLAKYCERYKHIWNK